MMLTTPENAARSAAPALVLLALPLMATPGATTFTAEAEVVSVDPIYSRERVAEPVEQCTRVRAEHPSRHSPHYRSHHEPPHRVLRSVIGGLIGGAVGSKIGDGRGRRAMTVLGAITGAAIARGDQNPEAPHRYERTDRGYRERCEQVMRVREIETISAYRVRYRYQGEVGTRVVQEPPGDTVPVTVTLRPVR